MGPVEGIPRIFMGHGGADPRRRPRVAAPLLRIGPRLSRHRRRRSGPIRLGSEPPAFVGGVTFETGLGDAENQAGAWDDEALLGKRSKWEWYASGRGVLPVGMGLGSVVLVWAVYLLRLWCRSFIDSSRPSLRMHSNIMYVLESILTTSDEHALGIHDPSVDMTFTHALARS